jgi:hypothetical protein
MILRTLLGEAISINIPVIFLRTDSWFSSLEQNCFQTTITRINEQTNKLFYFSTINNQQSTINNQFSCLERNVTFQSTITRINEQTNKLFYFSTINNQQSTINSIVFSEMSIFKRRLHASTNKRINFFTFQQSNNPTIQQSNNPTI